MTSFATAQRLLAPHRSELSPDDILRQRVYVFHSLLAGSWQRGCAFLLGDAAHMMPPFAGQGLNTGLRDAANLAWKLAAVLRGQLGRSALDSYEAERRPQAEAMVGLSMRVGRVMMTRSHAQARVRDATVGLLRSFAPFRRRLDRLSLKPPPRHAAGLLVTPDGDTPDLVGAMLPQPRVLLPDGRISLFDDVLGPWFALVAVEPSDGVLESLGSSLWTEMGARRVRVGQRDRFPLAAQADLAAVTDLDGLLARAFATLAGEVLVIRPDRFVLGSFRPEDEHRFVDCWRARDPELRTGA